MKFNSKRGFHALKYIKSCLIKKIKNEIKNKNKRVIDIIS
jgi:hypothetical protein